MASRSGERRLNMMKTPRGGRPDLVSDALRQLWATAESDPVPDDFLDLLDQLDTARETDARDHQDGDEPAA
jgi:hypothetical protein